MRPVISSLLCLATASYRSNNERHIINVSADSCFQDASANDCNVIKKCRPYVTTTTLLTHVNAVQRQQQLQSVFVELSVILGCRLKYFFHRDICVNCTLCLKKRH